MIKALLYGLLGGAAGGAVCFGIGYLILISVGIPEGAYFGVGVEPWNLPGTILGAATWIGIMVYTLRQKAH